MKEWDGTGVSPMLYSKTATGAVNVWQCWVEGGGVVAVFWGQLGGAMQEARFTVKPKNVGRSNETSAHEQATKEAKAKWVKQKRLKYSESLETAGETKRIKPMLAKFFHEQKHNLAYPVTVQPKLDGIRCLAYREEGKVYLQSRGGKPIEMDHIKQALEPVLLDGLILDGELYIHGMSLQSITSLVKRPREESKQLYYCIYDIFSLDHLDWSWYWRLQQKNQFFAASREHLTPQRVWQVPSVEAPDEGAALKITDGFAQDGYEGGIIRSSTGVYREGYRSPDLLKLKAWEDAEYRITNWTRGKGKFENAPIFTCITEQGKEFEVVPTGTQEERYEMLQQAPTLIGQWLKVKYLGFTEAGAPKCARAIAIRDASDLS
jgi:DNA ligase-1